MELESGIRTQPYGLGAGVGRALGVGSERGVGVGLGVAVGPNGVVYVADGTAFVPPGEGRIVRLSP